ncbi:MAG TPA: NAD(P)/FAD-dependent oxidoreductase [Spirochaetia bacterium]|nr:NAD(P)/FAD-dependent oxidoreductase [Spirochaetia bacterium]
METKQYDIAIIGAGIVGVMLARTLARYRLSVVVVEKEADVGMGQSTSNSAILHSGHDPVPGSVKARMNKNGNALWRELARDLNVELLDTGAMIVAIGAEEQRNLRTLYERAKENRIEGVEIWSREQCLEREPRLSPDCSGGLWTPTAAVIDAFEAVVATAENAAMNGVEFLLNTEVREMIVNDGRLEAVRTNNGEIRARWFVNSAGVHADEIMHMAGDRPEFHISARRGEYFLFDPAKLNIANVVFPVPSEAGKGVLVATTSHGNTLVGPNALVTDDKDDTSVTRAGMHEILVSSARLVPSLSPRDIIATFAGVRATGNYRPDGVNRDFLIEISKTVGGLINLGGIESPGFVSSPAIAEEVVRLLAEEGNEKLIGNPGFKPVRPAHVRFAGLDHDERAALIRKNPFYGRIVCRCQEVTEGEIVDAIHSPVPAVTYDAIKRRTWAGTGRCQGSFDYPRIMEILSRELNIPMTEITKRGPGSVFLYRKTKDVV